MKLKGTPASSKRGSLRSSLFDKSCIIEGDMSGREVGEALAKLSAQGITEMESSMPREDIVRFMGLSLPKIRALRVRVLAKGMGLSSSVGNVSSFLFGIQAKRVSFDGSCAEVSGPQSAKPGLFSFEEPASFFTGVVAGTKDYRKRR